MKKLLLILSTLTFTFATDKEINKEIITSNDTLFHLKVQYSETKEKDFGKLTNKTAQEYLKAEMIKNACSGKTSRSGLEGGKKYIVEYYKNKETFKIEINKEDCR